MRLVNLNFLAAFVLGTALILLVTEPALAEATGDGIFRNAAIAIVCEVLPERFGAMVSGFAGIFALVSAVTGNFRGAWALLFVSVGCYIAADMVGVLFDVGCSG